MFKSNFKNWNDVVKVDYTKASEPVHLIDVKKKEAKQQQQQQPDVSAIFIPRQQPMSDVDVSGEI